MPKRTFHPSKLKKAKTHGFRSRTKNRKSSLVLKRKIAKKRKKLIR